MMATLAIYIGAALAEIAGCFAFWAWLRLDRSPLWLVPGIASLVLFAWLLTRIAKEVDTTETTIKQTEECFLRADAPFPRYRCCLRR